MVSGYLYRHDHVLYEQKGGRTVHVLCYCCATDNVPSLPFAAAAVLCACCGDGRKFRCVGKLMQPYHFAFPHASALLHRQSCRSLSGAE